MSILTCKVTLVEPIIDTVYRVRLVPNMPFSFKAGQYLMVIMNEGGSHPFSLASTPSQREYIELHVGSSELNISSMAVMNRILKAPWVTVDLPHGDAWLREDGNRPLVMVAGGTGFSYVRSILISALEKQPDRDIAMYWGGQELKHLYDQSELRTLSQRYLNLKIIPVVERPTDDWCGRRGNVLSAILQDFSTLVEHDIYIAGRFEMAKNARKIFCNKLGAQESRMFGDAFSCI